MDLHSRPRSCPFPCVSGRSVGARTADSRAHNDGLTTIGGYLGLLTAAVAWYACLAGVSASTFGRAVLPNPPLYKL